MSKSEIVIALDAMGGDGAPNTVIRGANIARVRYPHLCFMFFGRQEAITAGLARFKRLRAVSSIHHADEVIADNDKLVHALRQRQGSSMRLAIDAVRDEAADGVVSAGNTGALMALAKVALKTLPGIGRPAMGVDRAHGAGRERHARPRRQHRQRFGDARAVRRDGGGLRPQRARRARAHGRPAQHRHRGAEGFSETIRTAAATLRDSGLPIRFHGFVEADDIAAGTVDVIATDGFAGNIALKSAEGTARLYTEYLKSAFRRSLFSRLGYLLARPALRLLKERVDPRAYNGAMFLGVNGVVVKSHGGTDHKGFANAIGVAFDMVSQGINPKIIDELSRLQLAALPEPKRATL